MAVRPGQLGFRKFWVTSALSGYLLALLGPPLETLSPETMSGLNSPVVFTQPGLALLAPAPGPKTAWAEDEPVDSFQTHQWLCVMGPSVDCSLPDAASEWLGKPLTGWVLGGQDLLEVRVSRMVLGGLRGADVALPKCPFHTVSHSAGRFGCHLDWVCTLLPSGFCVISMVG